MIQKVLQHHIINKWVLGDPIDIRNEMKKIRSKKFYNASRALGSNEQEEEKSDDEDRKGMSLNDWKHFLKRKKGKQDKNEKQKKNKNYQQGETNLEQDKDLEDQQEESN